MEGYLNLLIRVSWKIQIFVHPTFAVSKGHSEWIPGLSSVRTNFHADIIVPLFIGIFCVVHLRKPQLGLNSTRQVDFFTDEWHIFSFTCSSVCSSARIAKLPTGVSIGVDCLMPEILSLINFCRPSIDAVFHVIVEEDLGFIQIGFSTSQCFLGGVEIFLGDIVCNVGVI